MNRKEWAEKVKSLMEWEREQCLDQKDNPYFCGLHCGRFEAYEKMLMLMGEIEMDRTFKKNICENFLRNICPNDCQYSSSSCNHFKSRW